MGNSQDTASSNITKSVSDVPLERTALNWTRELLEKQVFNCESCGAFFKTAVFHVPSHGTVCQSCVTSNEWRGERLKLLEEALSGLPLGSCSYTTEGCKLKVLAEDVELHLKNCQYRPVKCASQGCSWQKKQGDMAQHFQEGHRSDVIGQNKSFNLNLAEESFVAVKLLIVGSYKCFIIIKCDPNAKHQFLYNAFEAETDCTRIVDIRHFHNGTEDYILHIKTEPLSHLIDGTHAQKAVSLRLLKDLAKDGNTLLSVQANLSKHRIGDVLDDKELITGK